MGKIKVNKNDFYRVLLTETLPYEVPITFLNEGLYEYFIEDYENKKDKTKQEIKNNNFVNKFIDFTEYTKPYNYRIHKNSKSKRLLSIPHASIQKNIVDIYKEYDSVITELCSRSPISLRAPHKVASRYYEKELVDFAVKDHRSGVEVEQEGFEATSAFASSFFTYKKYNFLYKFYDSYEANRIEKKFEHLTKFDISKCFHNIFVPSFGWAVKGKVFSKNHSNKYSIESNFENLMLRANEDESSGILVGPEFSRIFAEVILQKIDNDIISAIHKKLGLSFDHDYTIRRYVDDYFLYTKEPNIINKMLGVIFSVLENYKLFVNESKTEINDVPFITGLTIAKMNMRRLVNETFSRITNKVEEGESPSEKLKSINPARSSNNFIKDIKKLVKVNSVNYESISGYTLSEIRRNMLTVIENININDIYNSGKIEKLTNLLLFTVESAFFIYSMDIRVRTTYIITQIVVTLNSLTESAHASFKDTIRKKIYDESMLLLSKMQDKGKSNSIETLNLLISIKTNFEDYPVADNDLLHLFDLHKHVDERGSEYIKKQESCDIGYFQMMVLSGIIENKKPLITNFIENEIYQKISKEMAMEFKRNTELSCMFFDSMSNPYFSQTFKEKLFSDVFQKLFSKAPDNTSVLEYLSSKEWFFTWKKDNLAQILMKKELRNPY